MQKLESRIDALERQAMRKDHLTVWIKSFVRPAGAVEPLAYAGIAGERWDRFVGETAEEHRRRASTEIRRMPNGMAVLRERYSDNH